MCLITFDPTVHIAEEDMIVYKEGKFPHNEKLFQSALRPFFYRKFSLYKTEILESGSQAGYDNIVTNFYYSSKSDRKIYSFGQGFHSALELKRLSGSSFYRNAEFIIPKGSEYIKDETGLLVSNKIIFKQWV